MTYPVTLGGARFELPSLPWRAVRELQPKLLAWIGAHDFAGGAAARLTSADLDALADLVFQAVKHAPQGRELSREGFDELPITTLEMAAATQPILSACGLAFGARSEGADPKA